MIAGLLALTGAARAQETAPEAERDRTLLLFVGEELEVLTIASRREEGAARAPAIAGVMTGEEIETRGLSTLGQVLSHMPGFYMAEKEWGTQPYLRGVPDSILFLYDTVPLGSEITKTFHPIDFGLSMVPVKRVETVRGPGSVLWGPDAFAGIVNVVPKTGKDAPGLTAGALAGAPGDNAGLFATFGHDGGHYDVFFSMAGRQGVERDEDYGTVAFFQGSGTTPVAPALRRGSASVDSSEYFEFTGNASLRDFLSFTWRLADASHPYVFFSPDSDVSWEETRHTPQQMLKLEMKKEFTPESAVRATGYLTRNEIEYEVIDLSLTQKEEAEYAEVIFDQSLFSGRGLVTAGLSHREKRIRGAVVWDSFLPDFLTDDNTAFLPQFTQTDYTTRVSSLFAQYTHKLGTADLFAGARFDDHDLYPDQASFNAGATWAFAHGWLGKLIFGTAYRTPFARQLQEGADADLELEEIRNISAQVAYKPSDGNSVTLTGFYSAIDDHVKEDPYAGVSEPDSQEVFGLEAEAKWRATAKLDVSANLTLLENQGPDEVYHYNDFSIINQNGNLVRHFTDLSNPFDSGPAAVFNLTGTWRPLPGVTLFSRLNWAGNWDLTHPKSGNVSTLSDAVTVDAAVTVKDVWRQGLDVQLSVTNLLDQNTETPGVYTGIDAEPIKAVLTIKKSF